MQILRCESAFRAKTSSQQLGKQNLSRRRALTVRTKASSEGNGPSTQASSAGNGTSTQTSSAGNGRIPDMDAQWRRFKRQVNSQVDMQDTGRKARVIYPSRLTNAQNQLRREEIALANLWTSEAFMKYGAIAALSLLLGIAVSSAP